MNMLATNLRGILAATALLALSTLPSHAADQQGRYWHGGGVGAVECPTFLQTMERAKRSGLGSVEYVSQTQSFVMFLSGFQTAYNLKTPDTCNVFADVSVNQQLFWIENYCRRNSVEVFSATVVALAEEVHPRRLLSCK